MSIAAISWAKKQRTGSPTLKAVLTAIADYADETGLAWPSQKQLSEDTEMSTRSIVRAMAELEMLGFLSRERRCRKDGARASDILRLNFNRRQDNLSPDNLSGDNLSCDNHDASKVTLCQTLSDTQSPLVRDTTYPSLEPSREPSFEQSKRDASASQGSSNFSKKQKKKNSKIEYPGEFEIVWAELPTGGKKAAYLAWQNLPDEDKEPCLEGVMLFAEDQRNSEKWAALKRAPPIPPHLSTFINGRRFDDELERAMRE